MKYDIILTSTIGNLFKVVNSLKRENIDLSVTFANEGYIIRELGLIWPIGTLFYDIVEELRKAKVDYDGSNQLILQIHDHKKWLVAKIKYGFTESSIH